MRRPWTWWLAWGIMAAHARDVRRRARDHRRRRLLGRDAAEHVGRAGCPARRVRRVRDGRCARRRRGSRGTPSAGCSSGSRSLVALSVFGGEYANYVFAENHDSLPGGYLAGWLYLWTWFPVLGLIVMVPMLFPDGRVLGPGWRRVLLGDGCVRRARCCAVDGQARADERPGRAALARQPGRHRLPRPGLRRPRGRFDARAGRIPRRCPRRRRSCGSAARAATSGSSSSG